MTKWWWKFIPRARTSHCKWPVSEQWRSSWHCNCARCGRSQTGSTSCSSRRRDHSNVLQQMAAATCCVSTKLPVSICGIPIAIKSEAWDGRTDRQVTDGRVATQCKQGVSYICDPCRVSRSLRLRDCSRIATVKRQHSVDYDCYSITVPKTTLWQNAKNAASHTNFMTMIPP